MKTYRGMWNTASKDVMAALGQPDHHRQVTVAGQAHSYLDFARRAIAVGLYPHDAAARNVAANCAREMSWSTGKDATGNDEEIRFAAEAYPLPVAMPLSGRKDVAVPLPLGLVGAHLLPDRPGRAPSGYTLLQLLVRVGMVGFEVHRPPVVRYGQEVHPDVLIGHVYEEGVEGDRTWVAVFPGPQMLTNSDHPDRDAALRVLLAHHTGGDQ